MKKNLFVCHSQAHLILSCGLVKGRFKDDINQLILFVDFNISSDINDRLHDTFDEILLLTGIYPANNKTWKSKLKRYPNDLKKIRFFMHQAYDRVFEVCDGSIPELYILKWAYKQNPDIKGAWLEDGSYPYFRNVIINEGLNSNFLTRWMRKIALKYLLGIGKYVKADFDEMGGSHWLPQAYLTFKGYEREIYKNKDIIAITEKEYKEGILTMYSHENMQLKYPSIVLVLDKLDVYKDINKVEKILKTILLFCSEKDIPVYYKYHPRENNNIDILHDCICLNKNMGIESYYIPAMNKYITVIGIKSTGLQSAKKLGFKTISLSELTNENDTMVDQFYKSINILVPTQETQLIYYLEKHEI
ncbi:MAG: alpha-2,8-polysialyltransferase family protein [Bacteroidales bacterium]|jgi:hypothetical protein|nr:alpha-2,8-polysialyltransferase family protein [Bacteroidales bacterium]